MRKNSESRRENSIKLLRKAGIKTYLVHGVDDLVFPMERIQANIDNTMFDGVISISRDHNSIYMNPNTYVPVLEAIMDQVDEP